MSDVLTKRVWGKTADMREIERLTQLDACRLICTVPSLPLSLSQQQHGRKSLESVFAEQTELDGRPSRSSPSSSSRPRRSAPLALLLLQEFVYTLARARCRYRLTMIVGFVGLVSKCKLCNCQAFNISDQISSPKVQGPPWTPCCRGCRNRVFILRWPCYLCGHPTTSLLLLPARGQFLRAFNYSFLLDISVLT